MDTSAIAYRVADFLKQHPPFQSTDEANLRQLATSGRVRFFEPNEYIHWQGEPHKPYVYVIQQGTVALWDDGPDGSTLRDMRGAGDLLGVERFNGAPFCLYSATSSTDVVIYAFPAYDFEGLVLSRPDARQFVEAYDSVSGVSQPGTDTRTPQHLTLREVMTGSRLDVAAPEWTVQDAARRLAASGGSALAVVGERRQLLGVVTPEAIVAWVAGGGADPTQPVAVLVAQTVAAMNEQASVADGAIAAGEHAPQPIAVTSDGSRDGDLHAVLTCRDIARAFADDPASILREIRFASGIGDLQGLNHRVRALALRHLGDSTAVDWVAHFVSRADAHLVRRLLALDGGDAGRACWCVFGTAGRGESLTPHAPQLLVVADGEAAAPALQRQFERVSQALGECGFAARLETPFEAAFHVAAAAEWRTRYTEWLTDPLRTEMHRARPLFDLRAVAGDTRLWSAVEGDVAAAVDPTFLLILANDCLASLPPLTFFQDAVLDNAGEQATVFKLEESALRPLVDVGRVFGFAAKRVVGTSTAERLALAAGMYPEHDFVFREAAETLRILLRQQARIGISQGSTGSELAPALLSRHERHVLKSGFRSILTLLEFTRSSFWLEAL